MLTMTNFEHLITHRSSLITIETSIVRVFAPAQSHTYCPDEERVSMGGTVKLWLVWRHGLNDCGNKNNGDYSTRSGLVYVFFRNPAFHTGLLLLEPFRLRRINFFLLASTNPLGCGKHPT